MGGNSHPPMKKKTTTTIKNYLIILSIDVEPDTVIATK